MFKLRFIKTQLILFLVTFVVVNAIIAKDINLILFVILSTFLAVISESIIKFFVEKKFIITDSAVITGLIVGLVFSSDERLSIKLLCPVISILSKYVIRFKEKHIFNPAAFGILFCMFFFKAQTLWAGTYLWYILIPAGLYFNYRIKRLDLLASYAIVSFILFFLKSLTAKIPINSIFWFYSYFFIFFMMIEPKTTPIKISGKIIFGVLIAVLIFILNEVGVGFDVELGSLLILNILVQALNKISLKKI